MIQLRGGFVVVDPSVRRLGRPVADRLIPVAPPAFDGYGEFVLKCSHTMQKVMKGGM